MSSDPSNDNFSVCDHYQHLVAKAVDDWDGQDTETLIHAIYEATGENDPLAELAAIKRDLAKGPLHQRKCRDCGGTHWHSQDRTPGVLCQECGSQDTRRIKT